MVVTVPDALAAERLRELVEQLLAGELSRTEIRAESRERLDRAVEYGPREPRQLR